tara:strand:- start:787 stop:972 length:186 start_codon:yes stop_codon:yes gene_type:complete
MYLSEDTQSSLRERGIIAENEVVMREGDLFIAVNVLTNGRRIVQLDKKILENKQNKTLLKG